MHIIDLLNITDCSERDRMLRRSFAPYSESISVDNNEFEALIVLLNMTFKRDQIQNLCDERHAQHIVCDRKHLAHCINAVRWLHTHNLKYPDCRVSGQRLIIESPDLIPGVISSAGLLLAMGWANNSADINYAKLFSSSFTREGQTTCLAEQLLAEISVWYEALVRLGMSTDTIALLREKLSDDFETSRVPLEVNNYSRQLRFLYQGDYVAITPVISHALMAKLQYLIHERREPHIWLSYDYPARLGSLVGSLGGRIAVMHYPPPVSHKKENSFSYSSSRRIDEGSTLFDTNVLKDRFFHEALHRLIYGTDFPHRQQRQRRLYAMRYLLHQLAAWIAPVVELRDSIEQDNEHLTFSCESFEGQFLNQPLHQLPELTSDLAILFHLSLQKRRATRGYAFHPKLVLPIKSQLNWLLRKLSSDDPEKVEGRTGTHFYLHLSGLRIYDASALANPYLCGIPSLSALAGFCHDYERRLSNLHSWPGIFTGVAWYIRYYSQVAGRKLPSASIPEKVRTVSGVRRPGIIEGKYCDLGIDLVIEVYLPEGSMLPSSDALQAAFPSRFAGGYLHPPFIDERFRWCEMHSSKDELFFNLSRLNRNGCWVYPFDSQITSLEEYFDLLSSDKRLRPVSSGFVLLEELKQRTGSLERLHAYAESALGLSICINPLEMRLAGRNKFYKEGFWQLNFENKAILMKGKLNMG